MGSGENYRERAICKTRVYPGCPRRACVVKRLPRQSSQPCFSHVFSPLSDIIVSLASVLIVLLSSSRIRSTSGMYEFRLILAVLTTRDSRLDHANVSHSLYKVSNNDLSTRKRCRLLIQTRSHNSLSKIVLLSFQKSQYHP